MRRASGFTLIEILVAICVLGVIMGSVAAIMNGSVRSRAATGRAAEAQQKASAAIEMIADDLRNAGSGVDAGYSPAQPAIAYVDSVELMLCADLSGGAVAPFDTLAYDPTGMPKPFKLTGAYAPPIRYRTGAELIRWTLDVNNDGLISALDVADANGVDVRRTPNPNDYMLVRQVLGDSLHCVSHDNGGDIARVAPILAPGGGVPALFTVMFKDGTTWNWAGGPVPAAQLRNISSITVKVRAASGHPNPNGQYSIANLQTTVSLARVSS